MSRIPLTLLFVFIWFCLHVLLTPLSFQILPLSLAMQSTLFPHLGSPAHLLTSRPFPHGFLNIYTGPLPPVSCQILLCVVAKCTLSCFLPDLPVLNLHAYFSDLGYPACPSLDLFACVTDLPVLTLP